MARVDEDGGAHAGFLHALADRLGCAPLKHAAWEALQRAEGAYAVPPSEVRHTHGFFDSWALSTQWHPTTPQLARCGDVASRDIRRVVGPSSSRRRVRRVVVMVRWFRASGARRPAPPSEVGGVVTVVLIVFRPR